MSEPPVIPRWKVICTAVTLGLVYLTGSTKFLDLDDWHLMSLAREALRLGHLPLTDRFAYTPTVYPVVQHEWGWGFVLYFLATHGGLAAFETARLLLFGLLAVLTIRVAVERGATAATFVVAPPALVMSWVGLTAIRPQVATLVFFALWLSFIESDRRGRRSWIVPALLCHVVWLNLHAGFVVGMGALALHAAEQVVRRRSACHLVAVLAVMTALVFVNPYGPDYVRYLGRALTMSREVITEWQPVWTSPWLAFAAYATSVAIGAFALAAVGPRQATGWPLLALTAYLACRHQRHVSIFSVVWMTQVPALVASTRIGRSMNRAWARPANPLSVAATAWALAVAGIVAVRAEPWQLFGPTQTGVGPRGYPVGAVAYLAQHRFEGNVMNPFETGAFITWKLDGRVKVSMDGRYEVAYPPGLLEEQMRFYDARPGWESVPTRYHTDLVLARRAEPVVAKLATQTGWRIVYQDDQYMLFARQCLGLDEEDHRGTSLVGTFP
jgi:hypothetical protein